MKKLEICRENLEKALEDHALAFSELRFENRELGHPNERYVDLQSNKIKINDSDFIDSLCWGTTSYILGDFKVNNYELYTKEYIEKEKEKYKINYKAYLELKLELKTINTEIENTSKEDIGHKICMLNKKNEIEIKLAELESKL